MAGQDELRALLQKPQAGLRLVHLHLGRLENPAIVDRKAVRYTLRELGKKAAAWRLFDMPNGDLLFLYQGLAYSAVEEACNDIALMAVESPLTGSSPYREGAPLIPPAGPAGPLFHIMDLTTMVPAVLRYLDSVDPPATQH